MRRILGIMVLITLIWACSSDNGEGTGMIDDVGPDPVVTTFERRPMLSNWADNIIIPAYVSFDAEVKNLKFTFDNFQSDRTVDNLVQLRGAWLKAYLGWQQVSMFEIGPAETTDYRLNMNIYPTDTSLIEEYLTSGTYDLDLPSNRDVKGFPALDYLINGLENDDTSITARFSTGPNADNTILYMGHIIDDMAQRTGNVLQEWQNSYRDTFVSNDGSSATASVDRFVNDYIFYYEKFLRAGKMGIPLGVFSGTASPNRVEAYYKADISKELFLTGLDAAQDFFNGKHFGSSAKGESLASYLTALNSVKDGEALDQLINDQFDLAREMVSDLGTFRSEIENNSPPTNMLLAYDEVQRVVPFFKVDMVSAMSISIDFVDADGD